MTDTIQANGETLGQTETSYRPCECSLWWYSADVNDEVGNQDRDTGCSRDVSGDRSFAQGHDAKLKSLLIEAGVLGVEVARREGAGQTWMSAQQGADRFGFSFQVADGIAAGRQVQEARKAKVEAKALAKATKKAKARKSDNAAKKVKVGRWTYTVAEFRGDDLVYIDKQGVEQTISADKAKVVA